MKDDYFIEMQTTENQIAQMTKNTAYGYLTCNMQDYGISMGYDFDEISDKYRGEITTDAKNIMNNPTTGKANCSDDEKVWQYGVFSPGGMTVAFTAHVVCNDIMPGCPWNACLDENCIQKQLVLKYGNRLSQFTYRSINWRKE